MPSLLSLAFPVATDAAARARRVLVVVNDPAGPHDVALLMDGAAPGAAEVLVVSPGLNSWSGRLVADQDAVERDACARLEATVLCLRTAGFAASGIVGDADPLFAIEDALTVFDADEVVIATAPARVDGWLGETLAARARALCGVPVRNVAVASEPPPLWAEPLVAA
jgi:hypothetical protein